MLGGSLFSLVLALAASRPVFTADYYAIDGVSGKVASFIDWNDPTHTLAQATSANQVALPAPSASFNGRYVVTFATTMFYTSNRAASTWTFLHDGTGMDEFAVFRATAMSPGASMIAGTQTGSTNYQSLYLTTTGATASMNINNAAGSAIGVGDQAIPALGTSTWLRATVLAGAGNTKLYDKGTQRFSGTVSSPSGGAPPTSLVLGKLPGGAAAYLGDLRSLLFAPALSASAAAVVASWIQQDTGIAP